MIVRTGSARYEGLGKSGKGSVSTQSGVLSATPYGFNTRFENEAGTNPEELIAAAHAACFTMALSFALAKQGIENGTLATEARITLEQDGAGFTITRSDLSLDARVDGIDADSFQRIAEETKAACPVSKLLNADISLTSQLNGA